MSTVEKSAINIGDTATVMVDGAEITGTVYNVRANGWPCVETSSGRVASGPVKLRYEARYRAGYYVVIDTESGAVVPAPRKHYKRYKDGYLWDYAAAIMARDMNAGTVDGRLYVGADCTLDGRPAIIAGRRLDAARVGLLDGSGYAVEFSWSTVARVMGLCGGAFKS